MTKKLPTSAEKPLTDRERLSGVRRNLEKRNDEIIALQKEYDNRDYIQQKEIKALNNRIVELEKYITTLEDKLLSIASDYLTEKEISDIEDLIIDNFKQKFNK